jgi:hypothetical protein
MPYYCSAHVAEGLRLSGGKLHREVVLLEKQPIKCHLCPASAEFSVDLILEGKWKSKQ